MQLHDFLRDAQPYSGSFFLGSKKGYKYFFLHQKWNKRTVICNLILVVIVTRCFNSKDLAEGYFEELSAKLRMERIPSQGVAKSIVGVRDNVEVMQ